MLVTRQLAWFVIISAGILAVIAACVEASAAVAIAISIGVITSWFTFGALSRFIFGIKRHIASHLGSKWDEAQVVSRKISRDEHVNIQITLDRLRDSTTPRPMRCGVPVLEGSLARLAHSNPEPTPIEWESIPRSLTEVAACAQNVLYFLHVAGEPYCVRLLRSMPYRSGPIRITLEVLANGEVANAAFAELQRLAWENSVYRGKPIAVSAGGRIAFQELPKIERESIVLPADVMGVIERNVLGFLSHGTILRRAGQGTRHGILLHGPPGTGKTLVSKYLAHACPDYTVLLMTGRRLSLVRETCRVARLLAPSIVIMEDVDLIATDRRRNRHVSVLHELLDEMDGLGSNADCIFLLTTNRPEILEPALAARPGRIDQAIYFPLPDRECRRRLFQQFSQKADMSAVEIEPLLARTEGASPAFLKELFRKAVLMAAERGEKTDPIQLQSGDFDRALHELVEFGGKITRNLLGFPTPT